MPNPLTLITTASQNGAKQNASQRKDPESKSGFAFEKAIDEEAVLQDVHKEAEIAVTDQVVPLDISAADSTEPARSSVSQLRDEDLVDQPVAGLFQAPEMPLEGEDGHPERVAEKVLPEAPARVHSRLVSTQDSAVVPIDSANAESQVDRSQPVEPIQISVKGNEPKAEPGVALQPQNVVSVMEAITRNLQQESFPKTHSAEYTALPASQPIQVTTPAAVVSAPQVALPNSNGTENTIDPGLEPLDLPPLREATATQTLRDGAPAMPLPPARAETARAIASQMAAVISAKLGAGGVEIALNPEELGRVTITLNGRDDGMHMMIMAERPETLDLMRRHIAILSAEFEMLGYGGLSLDFGMSGDAPTEREHPDSEPLFNTTEPANGNDSTASPIQIGPDRGLDMRV